MSQFSIPLVAITATVIGGAAYLSHVTDSPEKATTSAVTTESAAPAVVANADSGESATQASTQTDAAMATTPPVKVARLETPAPLRARPSSAAAPSPRAIQAPPPASAPTPAVTAPAATPSASDSPPAEPPPAAAPKSVDTPPAEPAATTSTATQ